MAAQGILRIIYAYLMIDEVSLICCCTCLWMQALLPSGPLLLPRPRRLVLRSETRRRLGRIRPHALGAPACDPGASRNGPRMSASARSRLRENVCGTLVPQRKNSPGPDK